VPGTPDANAGTGGTTTGTGGNAPTFCASTTFTSSTFATLNTGVYYIQFNSCSPGGTKESPSCNPVYLAINVTNGSSFATVNTGFTPTCGTCPQPSPTPSPSPTPAVSNTPAVSVTPAVSSTPSISVTPAVSSTPSISVSVTPAVSATPSVTPSHSPSVSVTLAKGLPQLPSSSSCTPGANLNIYLNSTDKATYTANGGFFGVGMVARNSSGTPINGIIYVYDINDAVQTTYTIAASTGVMTARGHQC